MCTMGIQCSWVCFVQAIEKLKYTKPSPIQMAAIPLGLQFRDVIGVAETGPLPHCLSHRSDLYACTPYHPLP